MRTPPAQKRASAALLGISIGVGCLLVSTSAAAQDKRFELGAFGGYMFGGTAEGRSQAAADVLTSQATIEAAPSYGAIADFRLRHGSYLEASYTRQPTVLSLRISDNTAQRYDLLVQYAHIGGLLEFQAGEVEWFRPIFGGTIGATIYSANDNGFKYEEWRLSLAFEGGAKIRLTSFLGLRAQFRGLFTFLTDQSAVFCAGGGCAFAYTGTAVVQGEASGGAYVTF